MGLEGDVEKKIGLNKTTVGPEKKGTSPPVEVLGVGEVSFELLCCCRRRVEILVFEMC